MKTLHTIHHKKDETFDVNFFEDAECTVPFDFTGKEHLYTELINGDISPIYILKYKYCWRKVYTTYIPHKFWSEPCDNIITLNDITPNLSKYITEDNAVLFLSEEDKERFYVKEFSEKVLHRTPLVSPCPINGDKFPRNIVYGHFNDNNSSYTLNGKQKGVHPIYRKITIFLRNCTQSELQKAEEVAKELKEKYGVEEVNLCALHCFIKFSIWRNFTPTDIITYNTKYPTKATDINDYENDKFEVKIKNINKIITTNSTGISKPKDSERLQVIDCKEIFEEYLRK